MECLFCTNLAAIICSPLEKSLLINCSIEINDSVNEIFYI